MSSQTENAPRVLVLGATGMLGNAVLRVFAAGGSEAWGTVRRANDIGFPSEIQHRILSGIDVENTDALLSVMGEVQPDIVINCVGLVKQLASSKDPLAALPVNALLPHRLARLCAATGARLIHVSTDCVFDGADGGYRETDIANATDLYGRSKLLGEVDYPNAVTLRTSIIGRELNSAHSLLDWFLSQKGEVRGFTKARFSGLTTLELARVMRDFVAPLPNLRGLYHVSMAPISKFDLLTLVSEVYGTDTRLKPDDSLVIDRSLNSDRFRAATGYNPPTWRDTLENLRDAGNPGAANA